MKFFTKTIFWLFIYQLNLYSINLVDIKSYKANFAQTITNNSGKQISYNGTIIISKENFILWKYNDPIEKFVYIIEDHVTIIEPDLEQVILTKLDKEINILDQLKKAKMVKKDIYISNFHNKDYIFYLKKNRLVKLSYKDEIDNNIVIDFTNIKQNILIDSKIFDIKIPNSYDIIKK
jgi:outer membrane lipoprotein carrier protein